MSKIGGPVKTTCPHCNQTYLSHVLMPGVYQRGRRDALTMVAELAVFFAIILLVVIGLPIYFGGS